MRVSTIYKRASTFGQRPFAPAAQRTGFSLVELLVVIGIIAVLAGILFPTISKIRLSAQEADSRSMLNQIDQACQAYFGDFRAYPGPLSYAVLTAQTQSTLQPIYDNASGGTPINSNNATFGSATSRTTFAAGGSRITGAENLLLGLTGGLAKNPTNGNYYFDASAVGQGAAGFNPLRSGRSTAYLQATNISKGQITDEAGAVTGVDSIIPEYMDRFATPMPFLFMRSRNAGQSTSAAQTLVVNDDTVAADYNIVEIQPYTNYPTGGGFKLKQSDYVGATYSPAAPHGLQTANPDRTVDKNNKISAANTYWYPYDAYDYLVDPSSYDRTQTTQTPAQIAAKRTRKKDSYVLISAGRDRIYGTADDLTNFGAVLP